jgi:O-antigen/teichoic acid export membrane protein
MLSKLKSKSKLFLKWSEKYIKTDMTYVAKGGFWLTLDYAVLLIISFFLTIAFARFLPKEIYGTYQYILSLAGIASVFSLSGINSALIVSIAKGYDGSFWPVIKTKIRWGMISLVIGSVMSIYYAYQTNYSLAISIFIASLFLPFLNAFSSYNVVWEGKKLFKQRVILNSSVQIIFGIVLLAVIIFTKNIISIISAYFVFYTLLYFLCTIITSRKALSGQPEDNNVIRYGKHLTVMNVIGIIASQIDKIIIWHFLGAISVAVYSIATALPRKIGYFFENVFAIALPKLSQKDATEIRRTLFSKVIKIFVITLVIIIFYIFVAKYFYMWFFPQYSDAVSYSRLFAVAYIFIIPQMLLGSFFTAHSKKRELYILRLITPTLKIILFFILFPFVGVWGVIGSIVISQAISFIVASILFLKMPTYYAQEIEDDLPDNV